jgi:hypothetical protein
MKNRKPTVPYGWAFLFVSHEGIKNTKKFFQGKHREYVLRNDPNPAASSACIGYTTSMTAKPLSM